MSDLLIYMVQSGVSLMAFYLVYFLFLRKETFFSTSRYYLMLSAIVSFLIPLIKIPVFSGSTSGMLTFMLETITISASPESTSWWQGIFSLINLYYLGFILVMARLIFRLIQLASIIIPAEKSNNGLVTFVFTDQIKQPFSFFNYIVINKETYDSKHREEIIAHELIHIHQRHSLDILILEILTAIQWFNPIIWIMRSSLRGVHEYLADNGVIKLGYSLKDYHHAILSQNFGYPILDITHNFNSSKLKKRLLMMNKQKSGLMAKLRIFVAIPLVATSCLLISAFIMSCNSPVQEEQAEQLVQPEVEKSKDATPPPPPPPPPPTEEIANEEPFVVVEHMPEFPGGDKERVSFLMKNIKYPETAKAKGTQGTVYISFIVEKNGSITDASVLRGIGDGCDIEALRVINMMPKWNPGMQREKAVRTKFTMPIKFTLGE